MLVVGIESIGIGDLVPTPVASPEHPLARWKKTSLERDVIMSSSC